MQNVEEVGYVYKRVRVSKRRFDFKRVPAIKEPGSNGSVLLKPLPAVQPQVPKTRRENDGSAQWSPLIVGMGKAACGRKLEF